MMTKPGITELDKYVDSRYTLVSMVAKRARMIGSLRANAEATGADIDTASLEKPVSQAVREIADHTVGYLRSEAIERAKVYEQEKINAISHLEMNFATDEDLSEDTEE